MANCHLNFAQTCRRDQFLRFPCARARGHVRVCASALSVGCYLADFLIFFWAKHICMYIYNRTKELRDRWNLLCIIRNGVVDQIYRYACHCARQPQIAYVDIYPRRVVAIYYI